MNEYTATLSAWALFFSAPKEGASALMMKEMTKTTMTALQTAKTAMPSPVVRGTRYVPRNGTVWPISEPPMSPATALTAASGST